MHIFVHVLVNIFLNNGKNANVINKGLEKDEHAFLWTIYLFSAQT